MTIRAERRKKRFLADLQKAKDAKLGATLTPEELAAFKHAKADAIVSPFKGQVFFDFEGGSECTPCIEPYIGQHYKEGETFCYIQTPWGQFEPIARCAWRQISRDCGKTRLENQPR